MPLWLFSAVFGASLVANLVAGIWLLLHLTALTRTFAGKADLVPSPKPARASRGAVWLALAIFIGALALSFALLILTLTGAANAWIY